MGLLGRPLRERRLEPELLDTLRADDPDAIRSRRELALINTLMGNHRWLVSRLAELVKAGDHIVELGAGDARLARQCTGLLPACRWTAVDRMPSPPDWPGQPGWTWHRGNLLDARPVAEATLVVANLVLHHFTNEELATLGRRFAGARLLLTREPARRHAWRRFGLYPFALGRVTRHDMAVSIRAGFQKGELATRLQLTNAEWAALETETLLGAHTLTASKKA